MQVHILGICGTFMGGLAILASQLKHKVSGSDLNVYPPMSTQLEAQGIRLIQGFDADQLDHTYDEIIVGNVMRRGLPVIEAALDRGLSFTSGPEWLARQVLAKRHVLAVSGTHGKTTTASMLAWILEYAGLQPGFLIGGVPNNFEVSARLGESQFFVVEADEYDSAFFDKRSKFIHYRPRTLIINNIEFDHADIFANLAAIQQQFHHLLRTVPHQGRVVIPVSDPAVDEVLQQGSWTPVTTVGFTSNADWNAVHQHVQANTFEVEYQGKIVGKVEWALLGQHNIANALAAIAAAHHVGVDPAHAIKALNLFRGVKRRLEIKGTVNEITVYDDFAHHPTAIQTTLEGLRANLGEKANIIAVIDIRSNTMKAGHHSHQLAASVAPATAVFFYKSPEITWDVNKVWKNTKKAGGIFELQDPLLKALIRTVNQKDHVVFMSNGGFGGIHHEFLQTLKEGSITV